MNVELIQSIRQYVVDNIGTFHQARLDNLNGLKLKKVIARKNPYLFRAKNADT
ncbi:MAG: hypothetical protein J6R92_02370, partial [Akkermansia sp.]|nr:hypothetical protein [Akkermansia sp.]